MPRLIAAVLISISMVLGAHGPAEAHHMPGPCDIHWWRAWTEDRNVEPIKRIIRCSAARWSVPGGASKALAVAACESGFRPDAYGNGNAGVYQHRLRYWDGRYDAFTRPRWQLGTRSTTGGRT